MAEVSFYQLSRDPVERVLPLLAAKALDAGERLLVVSREPAQRAELSDALWGREGTFLAGGEAGDPHQTRQPVLFSEHCNAANGARMAILVDGMWRLEAVSFERVFLLFAPDQTETARELWNELTVAGHSLRIFKQGTGGGWREGR